MTFEELENRYYTLKGKHASGLLSDEEFQATADKLTLQDSQGRWWMIGAKSGKWYLSQEGEWIQAKRPRAERVCPQCGTPMEEGALFCGNCGYRLVEEPAPPAYVPPPPAPKPTPVAAPPVAKGPPTGLLIGCMGLLLLCCLGSTGLGAYDYLSPTKPLGTGLAGLLEGPTLGLGSAATPTITPMVSAMPAPTYPPTVVPPLTATELSRLNEPVTVVAPGGQVELDAETAEAILPSADELGVDQLAFMKTVMAAQGEGYGELTDYRVFDSGQTRIVDLIVFTNPDDAERFTAQLFNDYQGMGDTPVWTSLGDQSFARQGEVWVRVGRYFIWALGDVNRDQISPSVQRLQAFVESNP